MQQALRMILRGPAAWALALAVAVGLLELGNAVHASRTIAPGAPSPTPSPQYFLAVSGPPSAFDRRDHVHLTLESASLQQPSGGSVRLLVQMRLTNSSRRTATYRSSDFHLVEASGGTYSPTTATGAGALPRSGDIRRGRSRMGTLTFRVPVAPGSYFVVWDDGGRLLPPAV